MKYFKFIVLLFITQGVLAQSAYELNYLNGEYDKILKQSEKLSDSSDYYWNALMHERNGNIHRSIAVLESGVALDSSVLLERFLGSLYFEAGQYPLAKPILKKHLNDKELFVKYVKLLEFEENHLLALEILNGRLATDSLNIVLLKHQGYNYACVDSVDLAITSYRQLLSINPYDQLTAKKLVTLHLKKKELDEAIVVCNTILAVDSLNPRFLNLRARANFRIPKLDAAIDDFSTLYAMGDSSKFILKHLGISEINRGYFEDGREHIQAAYQIDSSDYETTFYLGKSYLNSIYPEKGLYFFDRTFELLEPDPKIVSAVYLEKQSVYNTLTNYNEALACYKKAYEFNPKPEYLFYMASLCEFNMNDLDMALKYYSQFLEALPEKVEQENTSATVNDPNQITISLKSIAELRIEKLKEELFFKGEDQ